MAKYWEDYEIGEKEVSPGKTITEAALTMFIGLGGFLLPLFIDEESAKKTLFGGRIAPGRVIFLLMGGLVDQCHLLDLETIMAFVGVDKLAFRSPLRAGDTIRVEIEIAGKRETSRPDRGIMVHRERCWNQRNELLAECEATHLVMRRPRS